MLRVPIHTLRVGALQLDEETSRYVAKVHRKRVGDELSLFDPIQGIQAVGLIVSDRLPHLEIRVARTETSPRQEMPVTVVCCLAKGDKPEQAMRDVTALGAQRLVLIQGERSVPRGESLRRVERLKRVGEQVARQCGRGHLPEVQGPTTLADHFHSAPAPALRLVCAWHATSRPILSFADMLLRADATAGVDLVVGPEGGLSSTELALCLAHGCLPVSLGPYVLRAEVAVAAALAALRAVFESRRSVL